MNLEKTINYEGLLYIVKQHFGKNSLLLEELVQSMARSIKEKYPQTSYVFVAVRKINPPMGAEIEGSEVSLEKMYEGYEAIN